MIPQKSQANDASNFPTFLITPYGSETNLDFKDALVVPDAPGRAVCMNETRYKEARKGYDAGKIYKNQPCEKQGFSTLSVLTLIGVAVAFGFAIGSLIK